MRWKLCCADLSLCCDPDRQSAIVPPLIHKLSLIVRLLLSGGCVEKHVVDYPVILDVAACGRESPSVGSLSLFRAWHIHIKNSINLTGWVAWRFWTRSYDQLRRLEEFNFKEVKFLLAGADDSRVKIKNLKKGAENSSLSHPSVIILLSYKSRWTLGHSITTNSFFLWLFQYLQSKLRAVTPLSWYADPLLSRSAAVENETLPVKRVKCVGLVMVR